MTGEGEEGSGGEAKSYDHKKAWFSINHSVLSDYSLHFFERVIILIPKYSKVSVKD
jgi:hypothetical protein